MRPFDEPDAAAITRWLLPKRLGVPADDQQRARHVGSEISLQVVDRGADRDEKAIEALSSIR